MGTEHRDNGNSSAPVIDPRLLQAATGEIPANEDSTQPETSTAILAKPPVIDPRLLNPDPMLGVDSPSKVTNEQAVQTCNPAGAAQGKPTFFSNKTMHLSQLVEQGTTAGPEKGDTDLTSFEGFSLPEEAEEIEWPYSSFRTKLPYLQHPTDKGVNLLQNVSSFPLCKKFTIKQPQECNHVRHFAQTVTASAPWVVEVEYKHFSKAQNLAARIKSEIKTGNVVVLRGHPFEPLSLNTEEIADHFHFLKDQIVVATGSTGLAMFVNHKLMPN